MIILELGDVIPSSVAELLVEKLHAVCPSIADVSTAYTTSSEVGSAVLVRPCGETRLLFVKEDWIRGVVRLDVVRERLIIEHLVAMLSEDVFYRAPGKTVYLPGNIEAKIVMLGKPVRHSVDELKRQLEEIYEEAKLEGNVLRWIGLDENEYMRLLLSNVHRDKPRLGIVYKLVKAGGRSITHLCVWLVYKKRVHISGTLAIDHGQLIEKLKNDRDVQELLKLLALVACDVNMVLS